MTVVDMAIEECLSSHDYCTGECSLDHLKVYDGNDAKFPLLLGATCGTSPPSPVTSTGQQATIVFTTNGGAPMNYNGFRLHWEAKCKINILCITISLHRPPESPLKGLSH